MTTLNIVLTISMIAILAPIVIYVSVKLGTYAFYRGRQIFQQEQGETKDGKTKNERQKG